MVRWRGGVRGGSAASSSGQLVDVADEPPAVVPVVHRLDVHHGYLHPALVLQTEAGQRDSCALKSSISQSYVKSSVRRLRCGCREISGASSPESQMSASRLT